MAGRLTRFFKRAGLTAGVLLLAGVTARARADVEVVPGVSLDLAERRAESIADINYRLTLKIPEDRDADIEGEIAVSFTLTDDSEPLQLDFREDADHLHRVNSNGRPIAIDFRNEHLLIPADKLLPGSNVVEIEFTAGSTSLNRNPDYLYTLFVPDRARTAFPLFDQPNLKATWDLTLELPESWTAMSNAPVADIDGQVVSFERTDLISSYLFSFVAGRFESITREIDGRQMQMLHRETDAEKVARNIDSIFELHAAALDWLEHYTGIDYPFQKFGFALIPGFQYGGMEHVGAIQYRASTLFLEEAPADTQLLGRAALIAHETAHMWFGDLVTMAWFNDVWTKEVFANFMAAKIVNPSFPDINHELNFLVRHYPAAYSVDRTEGANPIRQYLGNLNEAGQMYGAIIYQKAPIMMRELELAIGETAFRDGMQEYLETYAFGNATWPDLIEILDRRADLNLAAWSDEWVNKPGRPEFDERDEAMAYGLFPVNLEELDNLEALDEVSRAAVLINAYENLLSNRLLQPAAYLDRILGFAVREENPLVLDLLLGQIGQIYWSLLDEKTRAARAAGIEATLWSAMLERTDASVRKTLFMTFVGIAFTPDALAKARQAWAGDPCIADLPLGEDDLIDIAQSLAVKLPQDAERIIETQLARTENPDNIRRFEFLRPSLSADVSVRDRFFESLADETNRQTESWVLEALANLHHPLRSAESEKYVLPSLELLQEIQETGDIFFPKRWLDRTLQSYRSQTAADTVRSFLEERPDYNEQLRMKILQAADMLFRANAMTSVPK